MTQLTPEEEVQFTVFNMVAFDAHRLECKERDVIPPCWLCMNDNARQRIRQKMADIFAKATRSTQTIATAEESINRQFSVQFNPQLQLWKAAELERKQGRDENDPHAFFME